MAIEIGNHHARIGRDAVTAGVINWLAGFRCRISKDTPFGHGVQQPFTGRTNTGAVSEQSLANALVYQQPGFSRGEGQRLLDAAEAVSQYRYLESARVDVDGRSGALSVGERPLQILNGVDVPEGAIPWSRAGKPQSLLVNYGAGLAILNDVNQGITRFTADATNDRINLVVDAVCSDWDIAHNATYVRLASSGTLPTGIPAAAYVKKISGDADGHTLELYSDSSLTTKITFTDAGTGTHFVFSAARSLMIWEPTNKYFDASARIDGQPAAPYWFAIRSVMTTSNTEVAVTNVLAAELREGDLFQDAELGGEVMQITDVQAADSWSAGFTKLVCRRDVNASGSEAHQSSTVMHVISPWHWRNMAASQGSQSRYTWLHGVLTNITNIDLGVRDVLTACGADDCIWIAYSANLDGYGTLLTRYRPKDKTHVNWALYETPPSGQYMRKASAMCGDSSDVYVWLAGYWKDAGSGRLHSKVYRVSTVASPDPPTAWVNPYECGGEFAGIITALVPHNNTVYAALWQPDTQQSFLLKAADAGGQPSFSIFRRLPAGYQAQSLASDGSVLYVGGRVQCPEGNWRGQLWYLTGPSPDEVLGQLFTFGARDGVSDHSVSAMAVVNDKLYFPWDHYRGLGVYDIVNGGVSRGPRPRWSSEPPTTEDIKCPSVAAFGGEVYWSTTAKDSTTATGAWKEKSRNWIPNNLDLQLTTRFFAGSQVGAQLLANVSGGTIYSVSVPGLPGDASYGSEYTFTAGLQLSGAWPSGQGFYVFVPTGTASWTWSWARLGLSTEPIPVVHDSGWLRTSYYDAGLPLTNKLFTGVLLQTDRRLIGDHLYEEQQLNITGATHDAAALTRDSNGDGVPDNWYLNDSTPAASKRVDGYGTHLSVAAAAGNIVLGGYGAMPSMAVSRYLVSVDIEVLALDAGSTIVAEIVFTAAGTFNICTLTSAQAGQGRQRYWLAITTSDTDMTTRRINTTGAGAKNFVVSNFRLWYDLDAVPEPPYNGDVRVAVDLNGDGVYHDLGRLTEDNGNRYLLSEAAGGWQYLLPIPRSAYRSLGLPAGITGAASRDVSVEVELCANYVGQSPPVLTRPPAIVARLLNQPPDKERAKKRWSLHLAAPVAEYDLVGQPDAQSFGAAVQLLRELAASGEPFYFQCWEDRWGDPSVNEPQTYTCVVASMDEFSNEEKVEHYQPTIPVTIEEL